MVRLRPLAYYGGKFFQAKWINEILPYKYKQTYFEPFFGMGHVLLNRKRSEVEIVNDINDRLVNYWRVVRDKRKTFPRMVENSPYSRTEFEWALRNIDNKKLSRAKRALAFHLVVWLSIRSGDGHVGDKDFRMIFSQGGTRYWTKERIDNLCDRMQGVKIENRDALFLLDKTKNKKNIVIYCDPPYYTSDGRGYKESKIDIADLKDLLLVQKGKVAISGQGKEWNMLKWNKHKKKAQIATGINNNHMKRVDCLWTNF